MVPRRLFPLLAGLVISAASVPCEAKSAWTPPVRSTIQTPASRYLQGHSLRDFEQRLTPYLRWKINPSNTSGSSPDIASVTQEDLFALARNWNRLDSEFLGLYKQAVGIPTGMIPYNSPGGSYVVYYARTGTNAVDTTDTYGYGNTSWRARDNTPNGVPDYVDEVAWACDSVWQAEVLQFGFSPYVPYGPDLRCTAVIRKLRDSDYGLTHPERPIGGGSIGFTSSFELRNNWDGWFNPPYASHPDRGVRVTIAHEFFHAIQYCMTRQVTGEIYLDDYPVSWLEGTAVLMEEMVFDEIDDYVQYAHDYFSNPTAIPLLDRSTNWYYLNGIPLMFIRERVPDNRGMEFVRRVFDANYRMKQPFYPSLDACADSVGAVWSDLISNFHVQSYFTGSRARSGLFIEEAAKLPSWSANTDWTHSPGILSKAVPSYGFQTFIFAPPGRFPDTLTLQFIGRHGTDPATSFDGRWGGHVMLKRTGTPIYDPTTMVALTISESGNDTLKVVAGSEYDAMILVASNTDPERTGTISVMLDTLVSESLLTITETPDDTTPAITPPSLYPNPARLSGQPAGVVLSWPNMYDARVYDRGGALVWHRRFSEMFTDSSQAYVWDLRNASNHLVAPGSYTVVVGYMNSQGITKSLDRKTLFVVP